MLENGSLQNLSTALNSGAFTILAASDLATEEVPEPDTGLLLFVGLLLGCVGLIKLKKSGCSSR